MEGFLQWWTGDPWLIFISLVGGGVGVALILRWRAWPVQRRLLALAVIVLVLHVWEEWRFPGGLHYAYNYLAGSTDAYALARYPMSELTDMLTNVGGVLAGTAALIWAGRSTVTAITVWVVCVVEVLLHLGLGIAAFGVFGTFRLAARIKELRDAGHKIKTTIKRDPNGRPYAEYSLRNSGRF